MACSPFVSTTPHPPDGKGTAVVAYRSSSTFTTSFPLYRRLRRWSLELGAVWCSSNFNDYDGWWSLELGAVGCSLNFNDYQWRRKRWSDINRKLIVSGKDLYYKYVRVEKRELLPPLALHHIFETIRQTDRTTCLNVLR